MLCVSKKILRNRAKKPEIPNLSISPQQIEWHEKGILLNMIEKDCNLWLYFPIPTRLKFLNCSSILHPIPVNGILFHIEIVY